MATEPTEPQIGPEPVRFRPSKKRKVYRQRTDNDDDQDADTHEPTQSRAVAADYFDADQGPTDPTVVKVRNANRGRLRGVGFRAGSRPGDVETTGHALVVRDHQDGQSSLTVAGIADKFTHQTGLLSDLNDKHMFVLAILRICAVPGTSLIIQGTNT